RNLTLFLEASGWSVNLPMRLKMHVSSLFTRGTEYPEDAVFKVIKPVRNKRKTVFVLLILLVLAAAGAALYYLNGETEFAWETYMSLPDNGFNGIPVALLASNNPIGVIFSGILLRYLDKGGFNLGVFTAFNEYISDLIVALIIYFAGFAKFIKDLLSRKRKAKDAKLSVQTAEPVADAIVAENTIIDSTPAETAEPSIGQDEQQKTNKLTSILLGLTSKAKAALSKIKALLTKEKDSNPDEPVQEEIEEKEEENK
ncbi:MAG: ABC transporter permease, partial [Clostridia bacterium]|nr:ABC transporter permease [Clostridia bacterium]